MQKLISIILIGFFIVGCNTQPLPENIKKTDKSEQYEQTISYQDIIMKTNKTTYDFANKQVFSTKQINYKNYFRGVEY